MASYYFHSTTNHSNELRFPIFRLKTLTSLLAFSLLPIIGFSQTDSLQNYITTNIASGIIYQETGIYIGKKISESEIIEVSYAHRFHGLTIIDNGGSGGEYKLWKQNGNIFRLGYKKYHLHHKKYSTNNPYLYFRLSYSDMLVPKYTNSEGSNGYSSSKREVVSEERKLLNLGFGFGKSEELNDHFYVDYFLIFGISSGQKRTHKYSYGTSGSGDEVNYPPNTFENTSMLIPTIELGINIGFCWK